jgi:hypothetical protein
MFTTTDLGPLELWVINENNPTPSNHALILLEWADIDNTLITYKGKKKGEITGWNIDELKQDSKILEKAKEEYSFLVLHRSIIDYNSQKEDLENEVTWIEESLTKILNKYAKPIRITAYSKRWWSPKV